jgi:hypothetical protein
LTQLHFGRKLFGQIFILKLLRKVPTKTNRYKLI